MSRRAVASPMIASPLRSVSLLVIASLVAMAPSALATHPVSDRQDGGGSCALAGLETCRFGATHFVRSDPSLGYCAGSPGSYSECLVYHECDLGGSGLAATFTLTCTGAPGRTCTTGALGGSCSLPTNGFVDLLVGSCLFFTVTATGTSVSSSAWSHSWELCIDAWGPYFG